MVLQKKGVFLALPFLSSSLSLATRVCVHTFHVLGRLGMRQVSVCVARVQVSNTFLSLGIVSQ